MRSLTEDRCLSGMEKLTKSGATWLSTTSVASFDLAVLPGSTRMAPVRASIGLLIVQ